MAYPEIFFTPVLNVFITDAVRQFLFDHPTGEPDDWPEDEDDMGDERDRPHSLLMWLGRRITYDSAFRETWRARILEVLDIYLDTYGRQNPPPGTWGAMEYMLFYFRIPAPGNPGDGTTPLMHAAWDLRPDVTHLILLRGGANVNDTAFNTPNYTALSEAAANATTDLDDPNGMQVVFALIGAGADVAAVREPARTRSRQNLRPFMGDHTPDLEDVWRFNEWPEVQNLYGGTVREFIANDRAPYHERLILAMFAIYTGSLDYPAFI